MTYYKRTFPGPMAETALQQLATSLVLQGYRVVEADPYYITIAASEEQSSKLGPDWHTV